MNSRGVSESIVARPEEHDSIREEAETLLKSAKASGIFPTPIKLLLDTANIGELVDVDDARESFLQLASSTLGRVGAAFQSGWNKLRGLADLKKKVNYTAPESNSARQAWVKLHELGHQVLPWQRVHSSFFDDQLSLSLDCEDRFEREANDFAGIVLFQGNVFVDIASGLYPNFKSIFHLAQQFGASRQATARHFAEESQEPIALISYYRSNRTMGPDGRPILILGRAHSASAKFLRKFPNLKLPHHLSPDHPWAQSIESGLQVPGSERFDCGDGSTASFTWESWWNGYRLLVLLRKTPKLKILSDIF